MQEQQVCVDFSGDAVQPHGAGLKKRGAGAAFPKRGQRGFTVIAEDDRAVRQINQGDHGLEGNADAERLAVDLVHGRPTGWPCQGKNFHVPGRRGLEADARP